MRKEGLRFARDVQVPPGPRIGGFRPVSVIAPSQTRAILAGLAFPPYAPDLSPVVSRSWRHGGNPVADPNPCRTRGARFFLNAGGAVPTSNSFSNTRGV